MTIKVTKAKLRKPEPAAPPPPQAILKANSIQESFGQNRPALILVGIAVCSLMVVAGAILLRSSEPAVPSQSAAFVSPTSTEAALPAPTVTAPAEPVALASPAAAAQPVSQTPQLALVDQASGTVKLLGEAEIKAIAQMLRPHVAQFPDTTAPVEPQDTVARSDAAPLANVSPDTVALAAPLPSDACLDSLRVLAADSTVYFPPGSADLPPIAFEKLRAVGATFEQCPKAILHVTGHSDASGDEQKNLRLSWQRADNTVAALQAMGFDTARIDPVGFGTRLPSGQGDTNSDMDRRVEFHVLEIH